MDNLEDLEVLSIGANQLSDFNNILYLRRFQSLKTVCLKENPFCEKENYLMFTLAHLNQVVYLDYRLVDENVVFEQIF